MWTASYHLISGRLFLDPSSSISAFSALTPPCCRNDSKLRSRASCRYVSNRGLTGTDRGFCVIGSKWLMSSLNAVQEILQKCPIFLSSQHLKKLTEMKRSKNDALRDSTLLLATLLSLSLSLTVNRWLVLIDGCLPAQLNTNVRCIWPSRVNSSEHYTVSTPLCDSISFVIAHQIITAAIHLRWF